MIFGRLKDLVTKKKEKDSRNNAVEISYKQHAEKEACMTMCECKAILSVGARLV